MPRQQLYKHAPLSVGLRHFAIGPHAVNSLVKNESSQSGTREFSNQPHILVLRALHAPVGIFPTYTGMGSASDFELLGATTGAGDGAGATCGGKT